MMYNDKNFWQFKLNSGDEIICEVMEWPMGESKRYDHPECDVFKFPVG